MPELPYNCVTCGQTHVVTLSAEQAQPGQRVVLVCPSLDRRYRLNSFQIDARRNLYSVPGGEKYAEEDAPSLQAEFGALDFDAKFQRWKSVAYPTIGIIEEYRDKVDQIISSFTMGYAYPAVTSACCVGERILNRLVLRCREHFKAHADYKKVYRKDSFDDWGLMLDVIEKWQLIPPRAVELFRDLMPIRHRTIHYNDGYDFDAVVALTINKLIEAIGEVFGVMNRRDIYLVFDVPGEVWVRSHAETLPFVKEFVLPHCYRAHAVHDIDHAKGRIIERLGKIGPLTDAEFVELRKSSKEATPPAGNDN